MTASTKDKPETLVDEYRTVRPLYERNTENFWALIRTLIEQESIDVHSVTSRTKEVASFAKKISDDRDRYRQLSDVTDISGVRVICYFAGEVDRVARLIEENFDVIGELSVDKRKTIDPDRFGYLSVHYVVRLGKDRAKLPEYKGLENLTFEIQIRSILQHAWAEIEHDLGYKSSIELPKALRRQFSCVAGILELVDKEFDEIKAKIEEYSKEVAEKIKSAPKEVTIDNVSLMQYISGSELIRDLDTRIAEIAKRTVSAEIKISEMSIFLKMCNYLRLNTIQAVNTLLAKQKDTVFNFARLWYARLEGKTRRDRGPIRKGISLLFLGWVLATEDTEVKKAVVYMESLELGTTDRSREETAKEMVETRKKLQ